jgi:hypothetical protein
MKTVKMTGLVLTFCLMTAMVLAEAKQDNPRKTQSVGGTQDISRSTRPNRPERGRGGMNREEMYKQMLANRMKTHKAGIDELAAIKKIAEEEEATRTATAIQTLIDKKDKEFKDQLASFEKRRRQQAEKLSKRDANMKTRKIDDDDDDDKKEQPTVKSKKK